MVDHNLTDEQEIRAEASSPYGPVFVLIFALTLAEYGFATYARPDFRTLLSVLGVLAAVKVALVAWYFMHLRFANRWIRLMMVPALVLSAVLVVALVPDMVYPPR